MQSVQKRRNHEGFPGPTFRNHAAMFNVARNSLRKPLMRTLCIVILGVFFHHASQLLLMKNQHVVKTLIFEAFDQTLTVAIGLWGL